MKTIIATLLTLASLTGMAQNGGQFFENNVIRIEYVGYLGGQHVFKVCNKQNCEARIRTKADQDPAVDIQVPPNACVLHNVNRPTSAGILFRTKAETACITNPDMGWLEINTVLITLPMKEEIDAIREERAGMTVKLTGNLLKVNIDNYKQYNQITEVYSVEGVRRYYNKFKMSKSSAIHLNSHLHLGLNYIRVTLESGAVHQFVIRNVLIN
jgi:hypothetical protein